MNNKQAQTAAPIHELIAGRWSPRAFDGERMLDDDQVIALLEAARWAPSCFGDQPWRVVVANRVADGAAWQAMHDCLMPKNQRWAGKAPLLLLVCAWPQFRQSGEPNRWAEYDTGAAAMSICLQAHAMGLAARQMGGFDVVQVKTAFALPEEAMPMSVIAIGYHAGHEVLDEDFRTLELAERGRHPLGENFFNGRWGKPVAG